MTVNSDSDISDGVIGRLRNRQNPDQVVSIRYLREENAFVTSGIRAYFDEKEILIPVHLVALDVELMGTIVSAILEKLSEARDAEAVFEYVPRFQVLDRVYTLTEWGEYIKLSVAEG
ncbi:MAG: hypothetical protein DRH11_12070 [Deltaproteobacteria bacterium]|nr:MAG: hypothetical protein DRH11_12070 [Deltaproteobacteria bacterium]